MNYIKRKRIKYAYKFGKLEHNSARLCFLFIVGGLITHKLNKYTLAFTLFSLSGLCWFIYWLSHRVEKKLYPSNFRG